MIRGKCVTYHLAIGDQVGGGGGGELLLKNIDPTNVFCTFYFCNLN